MEKNEIGTLDEILSDMTVFKNPQILIKKYADKINNSSTNKVKLKEYYILLASIRQVCRNILRYETFFSEFYPKDERKIKNFEALDHHIHAYIEDLDILKEKLRCFITNLKNDLKKVASNKKEIENDLKNIVSDIYETFNNVSICRNPHHHKGMKYTDGDLIDSEIAHIMLKKDTLLYNYLKSEHLKKLEIQESESFKKAKKSWVKIARQNNSQIIGFTNTLLDITKEALYQFLRIQSVKDILKS